MATSISDVIFKTETISKRRWYSRIKEIMVDAGWTNLSSHPDDYDVMYSKGESGDMNMVLNIREIYGPTPTLTMSTSTERIFETRFPLSYTPGQNGAKGVFGRTGDPWFSSGIGIEYVDPNLIFKMHYHCNKNRIIIVNQYPDGISPGNKGFMVFMGASDRSMGEGLSSLPVVVSSLVYNNSVTARAANHTALTSTSGFNLVLYTDLPETGMNISGNRFMCDFAYGSPTTGTRGYVDGVFVLRDTGLNLQTGDIVVDQDNKKYQVVEIDRPARQWYTSMPSNMIAIRLE